MPVRFEYWQSEIDGQWYFNFVAPNGGITVQSAGYNSESECLEGIDMIKRYAEIALVTQSYVDMHAWN